MDTFTNIVNADLILITLLTIGLTGGAGFRKRRLFWVRLPLSVCVSLVAFYYINYGFGLIGGVDNYFLSFFTNSFLYAYLLLIAVLAVCYRMRAGEVVYVSATAYCVQHAMFCVEMLTNGFFLREALRSQRLATMAISFVSALLAFGLVWLLFYRRVTSDNMRCIKFQQTIYVVAVVLLLCIFISTLARDEESQLMTFFRATDLLCCLLCLVYQYAVLVMSVNANANARLSELLEQSQRQYEISKENVELMNIKCHDLRHALEDMRELGHVDEGAVEEMRHITDVYDSCVKTGNPVLDVILTEKGMLCANRGISFTCIADGESMPEIPESEMYAFFSNAIDNAVEAVEGFSDPDRKVISLTARKVGEVYSVTLQNYTDNDVRFKGGLPQTTKEDKYNHGYGVKSIKSVAEHNGGRVSFSCRDGIFTMSAVFPARETEGDREEPVAA